jgi:hypothetical protein
MQGQLNGTHPPARELGWYLARGGKEYGPLTDRELAMLSDGGNLKENDLLWKQGFEEWKPATDVLPLARETPPSEPLAVTGAAASPNPDQGKASRLKSRLIEEIKQFAVIFAYLWLVFFVFLLHEWIVLADKSIGFQFYGLAAINALLLGKIMLVAERLRFAEQFHQGPLIYPILYKAVLFSGLLLAAYVLEALLVGAVKGKSVAESLPVIGGDTSAGVLAVAVLMSIALVPFFAFRELARALGGAELRALILERGAKREAALSEPYPAVETVEANSAAARGAATA